jgi:hypothetical protein
MHGFLHIDAHEVHEVDADGVQSRREDQRTADSTTDTIDTTKPISHPWESCEVMIAAITTPIPMMPPVATTRMSGASSGSRLRPLGIITPDCSAGAPRRSLRAARRASRSTSGCLSPLSGVADTKPEYPARRAALVVDQHERRAGLGVRHDGLLVSCLSARDPDSAVIGFHEISRSLVIAAAALQYAAIAFFVLPRARG